MSNIKFFPNSPTKSVSFFSSKKFYTLSVPFSSPDSLEFPISCSEGIITEIEAECQSPNCTLTLIDPQSSQTILTKQLNNGETFTTVSPFHSSTKSLRIEAVDGINITLKLSILEFDSEITQIIPASKISLSPTNLTSRLQDSTNLQQAAEVFDKLSTTPSLSLLLIESTPLSLTALSPKILYLDPGLSSKTVLIPQDWNGTIYNASNGEFSLSIKDSLTEETLCILDFSSNIKAASFFYDTINEEFVITQLLKYQSIYQPQQLQASQIQLDTTNFDNNLSSTDFNLQTAIETLDESIASVASLNFQSFSSTLTEDITLQKSSPYFQILNPGTSSKIITLSTEWIGQIINDGDGLFSLILKHPITNSTIFELSLSSGIKGALIWYDANIEDFFIQQTGVWQRESASTPSIGGGASLDDIWLYSGGF